MVNSGKYGRRVATGAIRRECFMDTMRTMRTRRNMHAGHAMRATHILVTSQRCHDERAAALCASAGTPGILRLRGAATR